MTVLHSPFWMHFKYKVNPPNPKITTETGGKSGVCVSVCDDHLCVSFSDDVRSANIIAEENGVECLVIDRE